MRHCDTVGRDYAAIEKTAMMRVDPGSKTDDVVRTAHELRELGFTVLYVYASGITAPAAITDLLAAAVAEL